LSELKVLTLAATPKTFSFKVFFDGKSEQVGAAWGSALESMQRRVGDGWEGILEISYPRPYVERCPIAWARQHGVAADTPPSLSLGPLALLARLTAERPTVRRRLENWCGGRILAMDLQFTAVYRKVPEGFIAFVEELPGANTQGQTLEEARANLEEAVALVLETNRSLLEEDLKGAEVIREPFTVTR
jgi:predicted RNase H-like HicB family nuclease